MSNSVNRSVADLVCRHDRTADGFIKLETQGVENRGNANLYDAFKKEPSDKQEDVRAGLSDPESPGTIKSESSSCKSEKIKSENRVSAVLPSKSRTVTTVKRKRLEDESDSDTGTKPASKALKLDIAPSDQKLKLDIAPSYQKLVHMNRKLHREKTKLTRRNHQLSERLAKFTGIPPGSVVPMDRGTETRGLELQKELKMLSHTVIEAGRQLSRLSGESPALLSNMTELVSEDNKPHVLGNAKEGIERLNRVNGWTDRASTNMVKEESQFDTENKGKDSSDREPYYSMEH